MTDWQGYVLPGIVLIVYAAWGIATLLKRRKR